MNPDKIKKHLFVYNSVILSVIFSMMLEMTGFASDTLAPQSQFKPILEVKENPDGTYAIIRDEVLQRTQDEETVRSVRKGETYGSAFRNRVAFREIGMLIGQFLHLKISPYTLKEEIKRHIDPAELAVSRTHHDPLLAGSAIDELMYNIFEEAYYLPLYRDGEKALYYRYYINKDPTQSPDITIPIGDGREVYIDVINARAVTEEISELQYIAHDIRNAFGKFNIIRYFFTLVGDTSLEHGMNEIEGLNKELEEVFHKIPEETSSPATVRGIMQELKTAATKADKILSPENTRPRLENAYEGLAMQGVIQGTDEERERYVEDAVLSFIHAKNILQGHFPELRGNVREMTVDEVNETIKAALALISIKDRTTMDLITGGQTVYAEKIALMRVLTNIMKNASEAFALGGKHCETGDFHIMTRFMTGSGGKRFQIILEDKAGGMTEEVRKNIFKKGFSTKKANLGAKRGQGLAIAKKYMETHCGGTIDVASTLGEGTVFTLMLSAWDGERALREERERTIVALRSIRHGKGQDLFDLTDPAHTICSAWTLLKYPEESGELMRKMQSLGNQMFMLSLKGLDGEQYDETLKGFRKTMIEMLEIVKRQKSMVQTLGAGETDVENKEKIIKALTGHLEGIEAKLKSRAGLIEGSIPEQTNDIMPILERTAQKKRKIVRKEGEEPKYSPRKLPGLKVPMNEMIGETIYCESIGQKEVKIWPLNRTGRDAARFKGDALTVNSAIANIVDNAVDFAGKTTADEEGIVKIVVSRGEGNIKIEVIDNGKGMSEEDIKMDPVTGKSNIFNINYTRREGGTGVGLAEAWYAINDHGGSIEADSMTEAEHKRMGINECVEGMYLADEMENDPDLRKTVKKAYDALEPILSEFDDWLNKIELEDSTVTRQVREKYSEEIKKPFIRFLDSNVKTGPLRKFLYDRFVSKGFIKIFSLEDYATITDLTEDMIRYKNLIRIFERLASGKRILPGTTFTITLPEYVEKTETSRAKDILRATVRENMSNLERVLRNDDTLKYHTWKAYVKLAEYAGQMEPVFNKILNDALTNSDLIELDKQMTPVVAYLKQEVRALVENHRTKILGYFLLDSFGQIPFTVNLLKYETEKINAGENKEIPEKQESVRSMVREYKALMDVLKNLVMTNKEGIYGRVMTDGIRLLPAPEENKPFVIALGTSWIKGYEKDRHLQYDAINPLITAVESYCKARGIMFIRGDDDHVAQEINKLREKTPCARGIVLAGKATVDIMEKGLKDSNFVLAGVDNSELTVDSLIPLPEMIALTLEICRLGEFDEKYINGLHPGLDKLGFTYSNSRRIDFTPKAEPMDYEVLQKAYNAERAPVLAA